LRELARDADTAVDGGNGMGIVNGAAGFHSTFAKVRPNRCPDANASYTGYEKEAGLSASADTLGFCRVARRVGIRPRRGIRLDSIWAVARLRASHPQNDGRHP